MTSALDGVRLVIASPVDGDPSHAMAAMGYQLAVARILAEHKDSGLIDPPLLAYPADVVRARSRAVLIARQHDPTHILWLDTDVVPKPGAIGAMIATGHDWIGCPYPRKQLHWDRVGGPGAGEESEHRAYNYSYHPANAVAEGREEVRCINGCVAVERLSMGCTLTSMRALNAMWDYWREPDWFTDVVHGQHYDCVALFGLLMSETGVARGKPFRALFSEDYSACERYNVVRETMRAHCFGPIQMLVSHPADHVGGHRYRGAAEGLVYAR